MFLGPSTEHNDRCPNALLYWTSTSEILNLLYTLNPKKVSLPGEASQYKLLLYQYMFPIIGYHYLFITIITIITVTIIIIIKLYKLYLSHASYLKISLQN